MSCLAAYVRLRRRRAAYDAKRICAEQVDRLQPISKQNVGKPKAARGFNTAMRRPSTVMKVGNVCCRGTRSARRSSRRSAAGHPQGLSRSYGG